uniref:Uncharacterized protein n=1 Tax=Setaria viridis TaxID=4556 RepID=A0A4U6VHC6_SETVI|nr:hypothetical protein SEVIR_3G285900v2 [Setaria viridis]
MNMVCKFSKYGCGEIIKYISSCCSGDKLVRATEKAKLLILGKSMKGALTLVTRLKLPMLQEKFSSIGHTLIFFLIETERMLNDKKIAGAVGFSSNATITRNAPVLSSHAALPSKFLQNGKKIDGIFITYTES